MTVQRAFQASGVRQCCAAQASAFQCFFFQIGGKDASTLVLCSACRADAGACACHDLQGHDLHNLVCVQGPECSRDGPCSPTHRLLQLAHGPGLEALEVFHGSVLVPSTKGHGLCYDPCPLVCAGGCHWKVDVRGSCLSGNYQNGQGCPEYGHPAPQPKLQA